MAREVLGWSTLVGMGAAIAASIVITTALGLLLDHLFSTSPVFLFVGIAFGVVVACLYTISQFRKYLSE